MEGRWKLIGAGGAAVLVLIVGAGVAVAGAGGADGTDRPARGGPLWSAAAYSA